MDLHGILGMLKGVKGPRGNGEYTAKCPAHDDKQASLCLRTGEKGIVFKCQAGCSFDAICTALGVEKKDLFFNDGSSASKSSAIGSSAAGSSKRAAGKKTVTSEMKIHEARQFSSYDAAYGYLGRIERIYPYVDADGKLLFEVARIRAADGKKTFRQHRPVNASKGAIPFICNVPPEIRSSALYRLPEVLAAIREKQPVYIVEGEKDVDTICSLGYCGTTNAGGAGKWTQGHSKWFSGADVVIIPDEDPESNGRAGLKHGQSVADSILGIANSVKLIRLTDVYPYLPEKGDISDLVDLVGSEQAKAYLEQLVSNTVPLQQDPYEQAVAAYNSTFGMPDICIKDGCITQRIVKKTVDTMGERTDVSFKTLATFIAIVFREITKDDGVQSTVWEEIGGWDQHKQPLPVRTITRAQLLKMDELICGWPASAILAAGREAKDKVRYAIEMANARLAKKETVYSHTGWRKINGEWCYLYQSGSIGGESISVDLGDSLRLYSLDDYPEDMQLSDAALASMNLSNIIAQRVAVPLLGMTYLAPLMEFQKQKACEPAFALFLHGGTGTRKSTALALFLSHFGKFTSRNLPASFNDTANYVRKKAFALKDFLFVVDDYHPSSNMQDKRLMERTAQSLSRAFGDHAERGRLNSDSTIQASEPPRALAMFSGEDIPDIGESGVSRYYLVSVDPDDIPASRELTEAQNQAHCGVFRLAMRGYIQWLAQQAETLPATLEEMFLQYRTKAHEQFAGKGIHGRSIEAVAQIMIGLTMMNRYFASLGIYDSALAEDVTENLWPTVIENTEEQLERTRAEKPSIMFLNAIREMIASKMITLVDITPGHAPESVGQNMVGWYDADNYYFMPETVMGCISKFYSNQGRSFPVNLRTLFKQMKEEGYLARTEGNGYTCRKRLGGQQPRLVWIPRATIDGGTPVQTAMDLDAG